VHVHVTPCRPPHSASRVPFCYLTLVPSETEPEATHYSALSCSRFAQSQSHAAGTCSSACCNGPTGALSYGIPEERTLGNGYTHCSDLGCMALKDEEGNDQDWEDEDSLVGPNEGHGNVAEHE